MADSETRKCRRCDAEFSSTDARKVFCSRNCALAAWHDKRQAGETKWTFICQFCGREYNAKNPDRNTFCSRQCAYAHKHEQSQGEWIHWWFKNCDVCGERFVTHRQSQGTCSKRECRLEKGRQGYRASFMPKRKPCPDCGAEIQSRQHYCTACSEDRARKARRETKRQVGRNHRTRAKHAGVPYVTVTRKQIIKTFGTKCWICGKRIDMKACAPSPTAWSVDHVVPLALGGWHDLINVRPAHFGCNTAKSAHYEGQLMLTCKEGDGGGQIV